MDLLTCFRVAFVALRVNMLRSILTMLGIIIGVAAVITMVGVGTGAQQEVDAQINSIGANILTVMGSRRSFGGVSAGADGGARLELSDVDLLKKNIPDVVAASPNLSTRVQVIYGNINWSTTVQGANEDSLVTGNWRIVDGREFTQREISTGAKVAIIGETVRRELFGEANPIGQSVRINRVPTKIIGVLNRKGENSWGRDQDDITMVPVKAVQTRFLGTLNRGNPNLVSQIMVSVADSELMDQVESDIVALLNAKHQIPTNSAQSPFQVRNIAEAMAARAETRQIFNTLLAAIASVSLLVGGIGIMNIMLVSVTERTREIGLRLAVGAKEKDILRQFLVEAITLCVIGGLIGIVIALIVSAIAASLSQWPIVIEPSIMLISVAFSAGVGIFFGYYPARKASRLNPIDALHYE